MFSNIFKSKSRREAERTMAIRRALSTHRRHISELQKHEREYMEKAVRARKSGDRQNLSMLCGMLAQTMNERKAIEGQLLHFETLVQTRERMKLYNDFRGAMDALGKSVGQMFSDFNAEEVMQNVENVLSQSEQVTDAMEMILDRISSSGMSQPTSSEGVTAADIERIIGDRAVAEENSPVAQNADIDQHLKSIEKMLSGR